MAENLPWGISRIGCIYHPDVQAEIQIRRQGTVYTGWVSAVAEPYASNFLERVRAAWWVLTGRAHAFIWPKAGDLEAIWTRDNPTLRDKPLPFKPRASAM